MLRNLAIIIAILLLSPIIIVWLSVYLINIFPKISSQQRETIAFMAFMGIIITALAITVSRKLKEIEFEEMLIYKGYSPEEIKMLKYMTFDEWYKKVNPQGYQEWKNRKKELMQPKIEEQKMKNKPKIPVIVSNKGLVVGAKSNIICPSCGSPIVPIKLKSGDLLCPICGINLVEGKGSSIGEKNVK